MQSWPQPHVPVLADLGLGLGDAVRVHDTSTGSLVPSDPEGQARLYVCGITPYDATHLGHANTYLAFDLLQRAWKDRGLEVHFTQNVTDVDDPLLERATATGVDWVALAESETQLFREDMTALRILPPENYIGAVESIPLVLELIERLAKTGAVYQVDDDYYFEVHAAGGFGEVSGYSAEQMHEIFPQRGGDPARVGKRDPLDCLLWQGERPGEPSWDSPLGKGRPGWHIECSAIALHHLGTAFDVQGGGSDLIFPHHEMSAAEAELATGEPFSLAYVHAGMVGFEGEKMSKSKGNLVLVSRLRADGHDPMAIRLALLTHHYREDWEWFGHEIAEAQERLASWRAALARPAAPEAAPVVAALRAALTNDLDAPAAIAVIDDWAATSGDDPNASAIVGAAVDALLGVEL